MLRILLVIVLGILVLTGCDELEERRQSQDITGFKPLQVEELKVEEIKVENIVVEEVITEEIK